MTYSAPNAAQPNSQGATVAQTDPSQTNTQGNPAPAVVNAPPATEAITNTTSQQQTQQQTQQQQAQPDGDIAHVGDEMADAAIDIMRKAGLKQSHAATIFGKAYASGNLADIDRAALTKAVGAQNASLILGALTEYNGRVGAARMAGVKAVHEVMGGEENWNKVRQWARNHESANPDFAPVLKEIRAMLNAGGLSSRAAAEELKKLYNADKNNSQLGNTLVQGDGGQPVNQTPLSRGDYLKELKAAYAKGDMQAVASINGRRAAGRKAGI